MKFFSAQEIHAVLDWECVTSAIYTAHKEDRHIGQGFLLGDSRFGILCRGVISAGRGAGLKLASVCPENAKSLPARPVEDAAFIVVDEHTKAIKAIFDGPAITFWKTAGDSVTAARMLSREDSKTLLVIGAGPVANALVDAYLHIRPGISQILLWNRTSAKLNKKLAILKENGINAEIVSDLNNAIEKADIIASATSSFDPIILGRYVRPGTHVDLLGGYRSEMHEADNELMLKGRLFVDDRTNAMLSGDINTPVSLNLITESKIEADLYELCQNTDFIRDESDITIYKNAGGAHLDLAVSLIALSRLDA